MANEKNLKPFHELSESKQRELRSKGGKANGESRKRTKTFRDVFSRLLETSVARETVESIQGWVEDKYPNITADEAIALAQIAKAINGDTAAAQFVRDTIGEKPTDKIDAGLDGLTIKVELKDE